jgi:hypothetical protein
MNRFLFLVFAFAALVAVPRPVLGSQHQGDSGSNKPQNGVVLTNLSKPVYPKLARQAHIAGDVEMRISVRRNGILESADVISGPPMLRQPALTSAQLSQFGCRECGEDVSSYLLVYTFQLVPPEFGANCEVIADARYPQVNQSQNHVTLIDQSVGICDPVVKNVRSVKCLYLWRCGHS